MKKIIVIVCVALCFVCVAISIFFLTPKDYLAIQNDGVYFGMSVNSLKRIKGSPIETNNNICDTPSDEYIFYENIYGYSAKSSYVFQNISLLSGLQSVDFVFEGLNYDTAKKLINEFSSSFSAQYSDREGFYDNTLIEEGNSLKKSLGVNTGATGISCDIEYTPNNLNVYLMKQT